MSMKNVPLCVPEIRGNEWQYVKECLDTNWVSALGKNIGRFEQAIADHIGVKYSVACSSGTSALHIALLVAGIQPEDEVLMPTLTFVAPANAVRYVGAWPVFMDVQPDIWQMDPQKTVDFLLKECEQKPDSLVNRATGRRIRGISPVHILGHPVDMDPILEIADKFDLVVIEDATESLGATYKGRKVGTLGDVACFSFNGNKIITTGGGGLIATNNKKFAERSRYLINQAKDNPLEYIHNEIGYNYRLSNIQAALGVAQMEQLDDYIAAKQRIARVYQDKLEGVSGLTLPVNAGWAESISWLYTIMVNELKYGAGSRDLMKGLKKEGIESRPLWHPVHSLKPFAGCFAYKIEIADRLYQDGLSLPSSVGLSEEDQARVVRVIKENAK
jgi:perosamine synthetase